MSRFRRTAAALSGALLLQLTLLASGTLCAMHGNGGMAGMMDAPAGRAVHSAAAAAIGTVGDAAPVSGTDRGAPHGCDAPGSQRDCGSPWSAGSCASMTTCTATAAPSVVRVAEALMLDGAPSLIDPARIHSGPPAAPELPPPRA